MRDLTEADVTFTITVEPCDIPIEGNAMASGDPAVDAAHYAMLREQLRAGNGWAWCDITVTAHWPGDSEHRDYSGSDSLGGCSYLSETDFSSPGDGYYSDMKREALADLNMQLRIAVKEGEALAELLAD